MTWCCGRRHPEADRPGGIFRRRPVARRCRGTSYGAPSGDQAPLLAEFLRARSHSVRVDAERRSARSVCLLGLAHPGERGVRLQGALAGGNAGAGDVELEGGAPAMPMILLGPAKWRVVGSSPARRAGPRGATSAIRRMPGIPLPFLAASAVQHAAHKGGVTEGCGIIDIRHSQMGVPGHRWVFTAVLPHGSGIDCRLDEMLVRALLPPGVRWWLTGKRSAGAQFPGQAAAGSCCQAAGRGRTRRLPGGHHDLPGWFGPKGDAGCARFDPCIHDLSGRPAGHGSVRADR